MDNKSGLAVAVLAVLGAATPAWSQANVNGVRVYTEPAGLEFFVDGAQYFGGADLMWPATSKHNVFANPVQTDPTRRIQYVYKGFTTNLGNPPGPITADPALKSITLSFEVSYALDLLFCAPGCTSPGNISIGGAVYDHDVRLWLAPGAPVEALAAPNPGRIFTGWGSILNNPPVTAFRVSFQMTAPAILNPRFQYATPISVTLVTQPGDLSVFADGTKIIAPAQLEWGWDTPHAVGAPPVQYDHYGTLWVFDSWSDGGSLNHPFQMPAVWAPVTLTATFLPGATVGFFTSPQDLSLSIDGRQNWPNYQFTWAGGTTHKISAPLTQTDSQGRKYRFVSWSNGQPAAFTYTMPQPAAGDRVVATYEPVAQLTVTSAPTGIPVQVDGAPCTTPCTMERAVGAQVRLSAPPVVQSVDANSRLVFGGWSDSENPERTVTASADPRTYTVSYRVQNRVSIASDPPGGASFTLAPASADGFYDAGTQVVVSATPALGFRILSWSGDLTGRSASVSLRMDSPRQAVLQLERTPAIAPTGVRNAAGGAVPEHVAPGSLISIFGANLADEYIPGPASPLVQALGGVTVQVDDSFLPLTFVSSGQVNAQLASGLAPGEHTLIVHREGKPDTSAQIAVVRNAPGLFSDGAEDRAVGFFMRPDGSIVTAENSARPDETISVLGTGLGPYRITPFDGFSFDETAGYTIADTVTVIAGELEIEPLYAGRSRAGVGVDAVQFRVPPATPGSSFTAVRIRVNGQESNIVYLPVAP
jgi:uncharacterized protein (TIGR03437 family)